MSICHLKLFSACNAVYHFQHWFKPCDNLLLKMTGEKNFHTLLSYEMIKKSICRIAFIIWDTKSFSGDHWYPGKSEHSATPTLSEATELAKNLSFLQSSMDFICLEFSQKHKTSWSIHPFIHVDKYSLACFLVRWH